jgi:hypothetical protein
VIDAPPFDTGADQSNTTWVEPGVAFNPVGAPGTVRGVADTVAENTPWPAALTAATRNEYSVPFARPVTVADVTAEAPSANVDHDEPPSDENSTT